MNYTQYHVETQGEANGAQTITLTTTRNHRNKSNVSFTTEETFLNNQQRGGFSATRHKNGSKMSPETFVR